jgi:diguanylate cyclase (GGDEF)-like protein
VVVWAYDASAQTISPSAADAARGLDLDELLRTWHETPVVDFAAACAAVLEARAVEVRHAQDDERVPAQLAADLGMGSVRFEPLVIGVPVGMLSIEPATASPELHTLLPLVAASVARLTGGRESRRQAAESEFLLELSDAVAGSASLDEMLALICERVARHIGARGASIFLARDGKLIPRATRLAAGPREAGAWRAFLDAASPMPLAEAAFQSRRPVVAADASSPLLSRWWSETLAIGSAVAAPIARGEHAVGALVVDDGAERRFSDDDVRLIGSAAAHVAPAVERALEGDERTSDLEAAAAIRRLLEQGTGAISVEEAGEVLLRVAHQALRSEHASLLMRADENLLRHVVTLGDGRLADVLREELDALAADELRIWRLAAERPAPVFVENAAATTLLPRRVIEALRLESFVVMPLVSDGRPLGLVLLGHSREPRRWSQDERRLVDQLALEGSLVVENAALRASEHARLDTLTRQAFHDPLTKLPNRALFLDRLEHALARMDRRKRSVAVLFLDLDDFKPINDSRGHDAGDRLLVSVSQRLAECLRPEDTIARLGGDEFVVLLEDIDDVRFAQRVARRIAAALEAPFALDGYEAAVTASIGIAVSAAADTSAETLLRAADQAMYTAKREGKARYAVHGAGRAAERPAESRPAAARAEAGAEEVEPAAAKGIAGSPRDLAEELWMPPSGAPADEEQPEAPASEDEPEEPAAEADAEAEEELEAVFEADPASGEEEGAATGTAWVPGEAHPAAVGAEASDDDEAGGAAAGLTGVAQDGATAEDDAGDVRGPADVADAEAKRGDEPERLGAEEQETADQLEERADERAGDLADADDERAGIMRRLSEARRRRRQRFAR